MSFLQRRCGLPTDITPFICHSVLLIVHLLSSRQAHFHFALVTHWTMYVTLVLCLKILSVNFTFSICLSMARWVVSSFFTNAFVRNHVWHPCVIAGKTHWLATFLFRLMGRFLSRKISLYFPKTLHPAFILIETSCLFCFPLLLFVPDIYS